MSGFNSSRPVDAAPDAASGGLIDQPLTMTVHSLPSVSEQGLRDAASTRTGRWKMFGILLVCAAPVIASYLTYYVLRPEGRRNYGELIDPLRPLPSMQGTSSDGKVVDLPDLKGQWLFVSVADSACDAKCERHLYLQRQLREGLGKEKDRLDWVWLRTGSDTLSEPLKQATAQATVLHVDAAALASWLQAAEGQQLSDHLYVVDPMGNWMMRFPANGDPNRMRRDLERLLRASSFWDRAGR